MATDKGGTVLTAMVTDKESVWVLAKPKVHVMEDAFPPDDVKEAWNVVKQLANMATASEADERALKLAVYAYLCANGTSREGNYSRDMKLSNGKTIPSSVVPRAVGRHAVRRFMRGNMSESYRALKESKTMEENTRFVSDRAAAGIAPCAAFATADWLDGCAEFTPEEERAHRAWRAYSLTRASAARGKKPLEVLDDERVHNDIGVPVNSDVTVASTKW